MEDSTVLIRFRHPLRTRTVQFFSVAVFGWMVAVVASVARIVRPEFASNFLTSPDIWIIALCFSLITFFLQKRMLAQDRLPRLTAVVGVLFWILPTLISIAWAVQGPSFSLLAYLRNTVCFGAMVFLNGWMATWFAVLSDGYSFRSPKLIK